MRGLYNIGMQISGEQGTKDMLISFGRNETERSARRNCTNWSLKSLELFDKELQRRWYKPELGRWNILEPKAAKYAGISPYSYCLNNPLTFVDPDGRDAILVVFPDYKISTPFGTMGNLGLGGLLLIDNKTGVTKYYEYGRDDSEGKGIVRNIKISNVKIGKDGKPTEASLNNVLGQISKKSGQNGRIEGAYVESDNFNAMNSYAEERMRQNDDPERKPYSLTSNNCGTFGCDVIKQDTDAKDKAPSIFDPRPNSMVKEYQEEFKKIEYVPKAQKTEGH